MKRFQHKIVRVIWVMLFIIQLASACNKDFLEVHPKGQGSEYIMANEKGINTLLIGAYSMLDGVSANYGWEAASSNWLWDDIRGLIANTILLSHL